MVVNEYQLFHGTKASTIDAICRRGFDWRFCGKHGTAYGHGQFNLLVLAPLAPSLHKHGTAYGHGQFNLLVLSPSLHKHGTACGHGQFSLLVLSFSLHKHGAAYVEPFSVVLLITQA